MAQETRVDVINYERNAEIRRLIAEGTKNNMPTYPSYNTALDNTPKEPECVTIDGTCIECGQGKYRFMFHPSVVDKYAGTLREIMSESPCKCGGYMWLISIPPKHSKLDDMM